jgi:hypothetical protein
MAFAMSLATAVAATEAAAGAAATAAASFLAGAFFAVTFLAGALEDTAAAGAADALAGALGMGNAKDVLRNRPTDTERKREFYRLGCFVVMALSWPSASALIQNS